MKKFLAVTSIILVASSCSSMQKPNSKPVISSTHPHPNRVMASVITNAKTCEPSIIVGEKRDDYCDQAERNLFYASTEGKLSDVKIYINKVKDVNFADNVGNTPISMAARFCHRDVVEFLLKNGASPDPLEFGNRRDPNFNLSTNPLTEASACKDPSVAKILLNYGANAKVDPNALATRATDPETNAIMHEWTIASYASTPITNAAAYCNLDTLKNLLEAGADVNSFMKGDSFYGTPLLITARHCVSPDFTKLLISKGAKVNINAEDIPDSAGLHHASPLILAAYIGASDNVEELVSAGADICKDGEDAYKAAMTGFRPNFISQIFEKRYFAAFKVKQLMSAHHCK